MNFIEMHMDDATQPKWDAFDNDRKPVHDWRTYVTAEVREAWYEMPLIARCAVIDCCQSAADREEWD